MTVQTAFDLASKALGGTGSGGGGGTGSAGRAIPCAPYTMTRRKLLLWVAESSFLLWLEL